jgi:dienelactone hydrolase
MFSKFFHEIAAGVACFLLIFYVHATCLMAQTKSATPHIEVPESILHDAVLKLRVTGLVPGTTYTLRAEFVSRAGTIWRSETGFVADSTGVINPAAATPMSGAYNRADVLGLIWSMNKTSDVQTDPSLFENDDRSILTFGIRAGDDILVSRRLTVWKRRPFISQTEFVEPLVAALYSPYDAKKLPGVIVLGGSEGGLPRDKAALIASHGYVTLALAYFGTGTLKRELDRVPIEIVANAITWLSSQPCVDPKRLAIIGWSKGAELALLAALRNLAIQATIAIAPSSNVFQSIREDRAPSSSWTFEGKELPYAPYRPGDAFAVSRKLIDLYVPSFEAAPPESQIPVENITGPILLISGREDALWPSSRMADHIAARLKSLRHAIPVHNRQFDDAGHHAGNIPMRPTGDSTRLGGTASGIAHAQMESWRLIFEFLQSSIGR